MTSQCQRLTSQGRRLLAVGVAIALANLALSGCANLPSYERPTAQLPEQWRTDAAEAAEAPAVPIPAAWWQVFKSAQLDQLIGTALEQSRNLKAAASRIAQARAIAQIAGAPLRPTVGAFGGVAREKTFKDAASAQSAFDAQLGASFELDFWGRNRQIHESAINRLQSNIYAQQAVRILLQAEVATTYFTILSANDRLNVARTTINNAQSLLRLLQTQHQAGAISGLEVERQLGLLASVRASIPPIELERQASIDALAVLVGQPPQGFTAPQGSLSSLQVPAVAAGLPSALIDRRSDIRQVEANLVAAHADLNAARTAFFPRIVLTAEGGAGSRTLAGLLSGGNFIYNLAAGLTAPIFDNGRLQGEFELAKARQDELINLYQQSILVALREVADGLSARQRLAEQSMHQQQLIGHAQNVMRMTELRNRNGAVDFSTVLDAQRVLLAAQAAQEQITLARFIATVGLFRALGGGWQDPQPLPASQPSQPSQAATRPAAQSVPPSAAQSAAQSQPQSATQSSTQSSTQSAARPLTAPAGPRAAPAGPSATPVQAIVAPAAPASTRAGAPNLQAAGPRSSAPDQTRPPLKKETRARPVK